MTAEPTTPASICSWCFHPVVSVVVIDTPDGLYREWRHVNPADSAIYGDHRADALVTG